MIATPDATPMNVKTAIRSHRAILGERLRRRILPRNISICLKTNAIMVEKEVSNGHAGTNAAGRDVMPSAIRPTAMIVPTA